MSTAPDRFAKYDQHACYSGRTQDVLIAVRHLAEQMAAHNILDAVVDITSSEGETLIKMKRKATS